MMVRFSFKVAARSRSATRAAGIALGGREVTALPINSPNAGAPIVVLDSACQEWEWRMVLQMSVRRQSVRMSF